MTRQTRRANAFTLLELLIVVTLIGILSLIAMEQAFYASVRTKVAAIAVEQRVIDSALEAYRVDWGASARMAHFSFYHDLHFDTIHGEKVNAVISRSLSTPVAYMQNAYLHDPFAQRTNATPMDEQLYTYQDMDVYVIQNPNSAFWIKAKAFYGTHRIGSVGPDRVFDHKFANSAQLPYDPTNGVVSSGNIWRSQKGGAVMPPVPQLLGPH